MLVAKKKRDFKGFVLKRAGKSAKVAWSIRFLYGLYLFVRRIDKVEAYVAIIDDTDGKKRILGQEPWDGRGKVTMLGGGIKPSDGTPESAAVREVLEESELVIDPDNLVLVDDFAHGRLTVYLFIISRSKVKGEPQVRDESLGFPWVYGPSVYFRNEDDRRIDFKTPLAHRLFKMAFTNAHLVLVEAQGS